MHVSHYTALNKFVNYFIKISIVKGFPMDVLVTYSDTHRHASIEYVIETFIEYPSLFFLCFRKTEVDMIIWGLLMINIQVSYLPLMQT